MTDTPENAENPTTQPMAPGARSAWGTLTRTTRIWTIALVAGAAALIAAAGFGLGVFAGTEHGDHEHGDSRDASEYVHDHRDGPYEQRGREHDSDENDTNEAENTDGNHDGPTGGSSVAPKPAPVPPR